MANGSRLADSRRGVFLFVVLAAAAVARLPCGNGGRSTLAMVGGTPVGARIRCRPALRVGLRVDGTRYTRTGRAAPAIGCGRLLPLRAEPDVRGPRNGLDRPLDCIRTCQPGSDRFRRSGRSRRPSVRPLL